MLLLLLLGGVSAVTVPPPADVTVSCHNAQTTVSWKYGDQPQTRFRVQADRNETETAAHQYDLSSWVWQSAESSMNYHYVTVTAIRGGNQSEPADSQSFSFNPLKTPHLKCSLDFPPVHLVEGDLGATVSFQNPIHFYKELKQVAEQDGVIFKYTVSTASETLDGTCAVEESNCRRDVSLPEGAERYVTLQGHLCSRDCLGKVRFRDTERVFASRSQDVLWLTLGLIGGVVVCVLIVAAVVIFKVKGRRTRREEETPGSLKFFKKPRWTYDSQRRAEETCPVMVVHPDGSGTADSSEDDCRPSCSHPCSRSSVEGYREGGLSEDSSQGSACGASGTDDGSEQTECVSIHEEEEDGGYDRPHHLLDMGDEDMVSCYSGR